MPHTHQPLYRYAAPRHWPVWTGLGLLRLVCLLPHRMALGVGAAIGRLAARLGARRRAIVRRNLALCFPELDPAERDALVRRHFEAIGMSLVEFGLARWASERHLADLSDIEGLEHVLDAVNAGRGVLLLSAHFTTIEICATIAKRYLPPFDAVYRSTRDPFVTALLKSNRERGGARLIEKRDIKTAVRSLRQGRIVWYAPDQSYDRKGSAVIPFFGVPSMHTTATSTLARLGNAVTIPFFPERTPDGRYRLRVLPPLEDFPSDDLAADTMRYVAVLEKFIRRCPEQYFWLHRKFKNLPASHPDYYADLDAWK
jgi:Kdo2-lipid IVA lauroyltransferase/acyltransferase